MIRVPSIKKTYETIKGAPPKMLSHLPPKFETALHLLAQWANEVKECITCLQRELQGQIQLQEKLQKEMDPSSSPSSSAWGVFLKGRKEKAAVWEKEGRAWNEHLNRIKNGLAEFERGIKEVKGDLKEMQLEWRKKEEEIEKLKQSRDKAKENEKVLKKNEEYSNAVDVANYEFIKMSEKREEIYKKLEEDFRRIKEQIMKMEEWKGEGEWLQNMKKDALDFLQRVTKAPEDHFKSYVDFPSPPPSPVPYQPKELSDENLGTFFSYSFL